MTAPILRLKSDLRKAVAGWKAKGEVVGVVPTMGALHQGHLSLVRAAKEACDRVIVTIFVNPKQFNNPADLENYPRTEHEDAQKLQPFEVDAIYVPGPDQIYPDGFATNVSVGGVTEMMEGEKRPGHFDGVATVVTKLFLQSQADKAFFGNKDYQQLQLVKRLARDLDIPVEVIGCPTIREEDGLAMSSRNLLLSDRARVVAPALNAAMTQAAAQIQDGADVQTVLAEASAQVIAEGFVDVEYIELRSVGTLEPMTRLSEPARLLAAANLAGVRLIDNIAVDPV
ncbi:pantoate--beta-alanine ligase [Actibacterium mucosum KCTC 23349]|uniref:Pantothenate synthetase n=1 Tax=Actibacterium mucosum KCTC 23349 TaxID=1454373 RepID=A0A037ZET9_9RHOB|nr:pantoate--beta-alanine ligase [Actibacterium mucosum]KAJ54975.1 pantoate--beta-alanine ligase [Actibacterium mucosum KCTC 23349]